MEANRRGPFKVRGASHDDRNAISEQVLASAQWGVGLHENLSSSTGPSGPVMIEEGTSFSPGALFLGLDLAMELDQMAAKHRLPTARPA